MRDALSASPIDSGRISPCMDDAARFSSGVMCVVRVDDYKRHLRGLALHDDAFLTAIAAEGSSFPASVIDEKTKALVRVAATVAVDAALASFQSAVDLALRSGATNDEIVATLESVTPV